MTSSPTEPNLTLTEPPPKKQKILGYKSMIESVQKILECPVCYKSPGDPDNIHFCSNGHLLCNRCYNKILNQKCPTCRTEDWNGHHTLMPLMKQILSVLPKTCPFPECEIQLESKDRDIHVKNCQYRLVNCVRNSNCSATKLPINSFLKHLENNHSAQTRENTRGYFKSLIGLKGLKDSDFDCKTQMNWPEIMIKFDGQTFIQACYIDKDNFCIQIFLHGNITDAENYLCQIKVMNKEDPRYNISFSGDILSVDVTEEDRKKHSGTFSFSKSIGRKLLYELKNGQGLLCLDITIIKKE